jgi:tetratricopeptide (TPR) repeat protein
MLQLRLIIVVVNKMKIQIVFKISIFFFVITVFSNCNGKKEGKETLLNEYLEHYREAESPFADEDIIISTIIYMDEIIAKEGNKNIISIYYDKARLLFKLKRYNEALDELFKTDNDELYDVYRVTLFIRLGRNSEAVSYLQRLIDRNKRGLIKLIAQPDKEKNHEEINFYIQGLIISYIFADKTYESILFELTSENLITYNEAEILLQEILSLDNNQGNIQKTKELLLINMWPE